MEIVDVKTSVYKQGFYFYGFTEDMGLYWLLVCTTSGDKKYICIALINLDPKFSLGRVNKWSI